MPPEKASSIAETLAIIDESFIIIHEFDVNNASIQVIIFVSKAIISRKIINFDTKIMTFYSTIFRIFSGIFT